MNFEDLHLHSTYSLLDAYGTPKQIVERAKELGRRSVALTDHGSVSGYVQFMKACKEANLKAIYGYEAYIVDSIDKMFEEKQRKKHHITLLAENEQGYRNILKLASLAYEKGFYYKPTIDFQLLYDNSEGIILLSGCWSGHLQAKLLEKDFHSSEMLISKYKTVFGDRFYLETQHYGLFKDTISPLIDYSRQFDVPVVLTCDSHFLLPEQAYIQEILHAIRDRRTYDETKLFADAYQFDSESLFRLVNDRFGDCGWDKIFDNTSEVSDRCDVKIPIGAYPKFSLSEGQKLDEEFSKLIEIGLVKRGLKDAGEVYQKRLEREKKVIEEKGFFDYLMVASDLIRWAKSNKILVGSGRGSSSGSLICYLLEITELDPVKYDLLFERFIDETRYDPPDIDTDFEAEKRDLVKEYVANKYGDDRVCDVATFAQFKGRNSLDEVGKVFSIPIGAVNTVKKYLVDRAGADMRAELTIQDAFEMAPEAKQVSENYPNILKACSLEGQLRHMSTHAAGVIISASPLSETIAIYEKKDKAGYRRKLSAVEMKDASAIGLIKIDFLGLIELSIIRRVAEVVGMSIEDIYRIPLDDDDTYKGFRDCDVGGIFQYDGESTKNILREMPFVDFEQLAACLSLSKPGPAHAGTTTKYLASMRGHENVKGFNWHPILDDVTRNTYGQIVYQEQIIRILRDFADFSVTDANKCRVVIAKSQGEQEFEKYYPAFANGTKGKVSDKEAKELWEAIKVFGRYAFNRSHAVSYALLGFWSMYFKRHHPMEFYVAKLDHEHDVGTKVRLLMEIDRKGVKIFPPLLGRSEKGWSVDGGGLRAGLLDIKGIGDKTIDKLVAGGYQDRKDFEKKTKGITATAYKAIDLASAFSDSECPKDYFGIHRYDSLDLICPSRVLSKDIQYGDREKSITTAGIFTEMNYKDIIEDRRSKGKSVENLKDPEKVKYSMMILEDETDRCFVQVDRFLFHRIGQEVWDAYNNGKFVVVEGEKPEGWRGIKARSIKSYTADEIANITTQLPNIKKVVKLIGKCDGCTLNSRPMVKGQKGVQNNIVLIGEAPGHDEVEEGKPFVGRAGKKLGSILSEIGINKNDLYVSNSCLCHPIDASGNNRKPTPEEIACCNDRLLASLKSINPKVVVALGGTAYYALTGKEVIKVGDVVGKYHVCKNGIPLFCSYHPSFVLRSPSYEPIMKGHLEEVFNKYGR